MCFHIIHIWGVLQPRPWPLNSVSPKLLLPIPVLRIGHSASGKVCYDSGFCQHLSKVIRTCVRISKCPQAQLFFPLPSFHLLPFAWGLKLPRGVSCYTCPQWGEALCDLLWREPAQCWMKVKGVQNGCHMVIRGAMLLKDGTLFLH